MTCLFLVCLFRCLIVFADGANPDVAEADRVSVFVEFQISGRGVGFVVVTERPVGRVAVKVFSVVEQNAVVDHGDVGAFDQFTFVVPAWSFEDDVVGLPLAGCLEAFLRGGFCPYMEPTMPSA